MSPTQSVAVVFGLLAGSSIGSFANVVIDRLPLRRAESGASLDGIAGAHWDTRPWREVLHGPSRCGSCRRRLGTLELIPVLSWLALRGRCRGCGHQIEAYHPLVEILVPALGAAVVLERGLVWQTVVLWWLVVVGVVVAVVDLRTLLVPNRIVWPALVVAVVLIIVGAVVDQSISVLIWAAIGAGCVAGPLWLIWWFRPAAMGFGDVRLGGFLGVVLGSVGAGPSTRIIDVVWLAVLCLGVSALVGLALAVATTRLRHSAQIPFAPALVIATFIVSLYSGRLLAALGS